MLGCYKAAGFMANNGIQKSERALIMQQAHAHYNALLPLKTVASTYRKVTEIGRAEGVA